MIDVIIVISHWMHVLAAVVWIGGIAAILLVVLPSGRKVLSGEAPRLMAEVSQRFTPLANISIGLLVITGLVLVFSQSPETGANRWSWSLGLKLLLAMLMFLIHFYRNLFLAPDIGRTTSETSKASLRKLSLNLVKMNFGVAILVVLISSILATV
jgi:uncharacterized membrane protein